MDMNSALTKFGESLGANFSGLIVTLVILVAGVIIAKFLKNVFVSVFKKTTINSKLNSIVPNVDVATLCGSLIYYVVLLNVLLIVLERMNITAVLDPLKDLASQFLAIIPDLIGAGIVLYAGWIIATIVKNLVEAFTTKLDEWLVSKNFQVSIKISKVLSFFVFAIVFLPIAIQALDILGFEAITVPAKEMLAQFITVFSRLILASVILVTTYYVAKFLLNLFGEILDGLSVNSLPTKLGMNEVLPKNLTLTSLVQKICMFFIMLAAITTAVDLLQVEILTSLFENVLMFGGKLLVGGIILLIGSVLANLAYKKISLVPDNKFIANIARYAIFGLVLSMGLKEMGLADNIVNMAFGLTLGSIAIAGAISFGVGGIDAAKELTSSWVKKARK